ncbi:hypothetical protein DRH27_05670, partial [Candidatus Falkowbacteria bacterium]
MNFREFLKPNKNSIKIILSYFLFLVFILFFIFIFAGYLFSDIFGLSLFDYLPSNIALTLVLLLFFFVVYMAGQALGIWLWRYRSRLGRWFVYGTGILLSLISLSIMIEEGTFRTERG